MSQEILVVSDSSFSTTAASALPEKTTEKREPEIIELDIAQLKKQVEAREEVFRSPTARRLLQTGLTIADRCFPTGVCDLSSLMDGSGGFMLQGEKTNDRSGYSVRQAGDINSDGMDDLIVGAYQASPAGRTNAGKSYVVFGSTNTSAWGNGIFNISSLMNGQQGFVLQGEAAGDWSGCSVSQAGDINGDSVDDLVVGASLADAAGRNDTGKTYVVFGSTNASVWNDGIFNISSLMDGQQGFVLQGEASTDYSGYSVSQAGDINGDSVDDLVVGAYAADPAGRSTAGKTYVVFGNRNASAWGNGTLDLSGLIDGQRGFVLQGEASTDRSGWSVSRAGDVNGDGVDDLIVGAYYASSVGRGSAGKSYVLFGNRTANAWGNGIFNINSLMDGQRGFVLQGETGSDQSGYSVSHAGDINGDGTDDLVVGAPYANPAGRTDAGKSYVVFGNRNASAWGNGTLDLSGLIDGQRGFVLQGEAAGDYSGYSVSQAGDINGDSVDDLVVGAYGADPAGRSAAGKTYVVFGSTDASAWGNGTLDLSSLIMTERGFVLQGEAATDYSGYSVSQAGDINGDGASDLLIGAYSAEPAGRYETGKTYVVFGSRNYNQAPVFVNNQMVIHQRETVILTPTILAGSDDQTASSELLYLLSNVQQGQFAWITAPTIAITEFFQGNVSSGLIQFTQDDSSLAPSYRVRLSDGSRMSAPVMANVTFYRQPSLNLMAYSLLEGATQTMSTSLIQILDDYPDSQVMLNVSNVPPGQFILAPPGIFNVSQFSYAQLLAGQVSFQHDGGEVAPSYALTLQDPYFSLPAVTSNITLIHINDPPVLIRNQLSILQGENITITTNQLFSIDPDNNDAQLTFYISNIQRGTFYITTPLVPIYSFTQANILQNEIHFIHDNSNLAPYYQVVVSDGSLSSLPQNVVVTFNGINRPPVLLSAVFGVSEGQSVTLSATQFSASDVDTPADQIMFMVSQVQHGRFERYTFPGVAISQFSLSEVQQNTIRFVHDGSESAPSIEVAVTDGVSTTTPRAAVISYTPINNAPVLVNNTLTISEGGTTVLKSASLAATDRDNPISGLTFTVSQVQQGRFELSNNTGRAINSFIQQQVTDGQVQFVHDGGEIAPSYQTSVSDGSLSTLPQTATVIYTPVNDAPRILLNQLTISEGGSVILSTSQLQIEDPDNSANELLVTPSAIEGGHFEQVFDPGVALTSFTYQSVQSGFIRFVHDGSEIPAAYTLTVSDGFLSSASVPAVITYIPVNDPPILTMNRLTLEEGEAVTFTSEQLSATDPDDPAEDLVFTVSQVQAGLFVEVDSGASTLNFAQQSVQSREIAFSHDGSKTAPVYFISVSDGQLSSPAQQAAINFTSINDTPEIITNTLTITQGQSVLLTSADLRAEDEETASDDLLLTVSNLTHGRFEYVASTGEAITTFSQDKIRKAEIRFVGDGSAYTPSYQVQVSDGVLTSNSSTAIVNFNLAPAEAKATGLSTRDVISLLSALGSIGLTAAGYLWWRNKTAEHRQGHDFANYLRQFLNLEYYDFTKGDGDIYKTKAHKLVDRINMRHQDFYDHLTSAEREAFALCVAGSIVQKDLLQRSESASGLFNCLLCFSVGWSNQLKLKEMDKALTTIGDEAVTAWKAETAPLERWNYKPKSTRAKISAFFSTKNCSASRPEILEEVRQVSEHKSTEKVELLTEEVELSTYHQSAQTSKTGVSEMKASATSARGIGQGAGLFDQSEVIALRQDLTAVQEKLNAVWVHLGQAKQ